jgi:hypothetical protein
MRIEAAGRLFDVMHHTSLIQAASSALKEPSCNSSDRRVFDKLFMGDRRAGGLINS